jgi:sarcosine oxidase delta subunit
MGKKYTIEFIREEFAKEGYILLSKIYEGAHQKLKCIHPNDQEYNISWSNWQQGKRDPKCGGLNKLTIEFVRSEFEKKGCILLAKEYKDAQTKMDYICENGHSHSISWNNWRSGKNGTRCPYCYGNVPFTIEEVREEFTKKGAILLTPVYINNRQKLDYICKRGHKTTTTLDNWRQDHGCKYCVGNAKHTIEFIRSEFDKAGLELLSPVYIGRHKKLKYKCKKRGHIHYMSYGKLKYGRNCPMCAIENNTGSGNPNWKGGISGDPYCPIWRDKEYAESIKQRDGYKCMNPCCNSKNPNDLVRHHINYDKQDCRLKNIITTCTSCNPAANYGREFYEAWYKAIMYRRYGYTYEENK